MKESFSDRALVLGGGGLTGMSWEIGVLAGLARSGVDAVASADVVIGTSAGATVGAQITSGISLSALFVRYSEHPPAGGAIPGIDLSALIARLSAMMTVESDGRLARARIGALALAQDRVSEGERRSAIAKRLLVQGWPRKPPDLWITAIDAESGELRVFDAGTRVELVDAVTASSAIPVLWPAVTIGGSRYFDGAFRSSTNADLADGFSRVLILQPMHIGETADVQALKRTSCVHCILPDQYAASVMSDVFDTTAAAKAAQEGFRQGRACAAAVASMWLL